VDWHGKKYYSISLIKNPTGPDSGFRRIFRGGFWYDTSNTLHVASRFIENSPGDRKDNFGKVAFTSGLVFDAHQI